MKPASLVLIFFVLFVLAGCASGQSVKLLGPVEFSKLINKGDAFILDVHVPEQEHIRGTNARIPYDKLAENSNKLPSDKSTPIAVYCRSGSMSAEAAYTLTKMGYTNIYELEGGANEWRNAGLEFGEIEEYVKKDIVVYKSPTCGCCVGYEAELRSDGFNVKEVNAVDMQSIKERYGVPSSLESCHTSVIGDYFVEGHVPLEAVNRLLKERPDIDGIALPGMPAGSPGMPGRKAGEFVIYSVSNGNISEFMRI